MRHFIITDFNRAKKKSVYTVRVYFSILLLSIMYETGVEPTLL